MFTPVTSLNPLARIGAGMVKAPMRDPNEKVALPKIGFGGVSTIDQIYPETWTRISPQVLAKVPEAAVSLDAKRVAQPKQPIEAPQQEAMGGLLPTANAMSDDDIINELISQWYSDEEIVAAFDEMEAAPQVEKQAVEQPQVEQGFLGWLGEKIGESFKGGISQIWEAWQQLGRGEISIPSAFARWAAWAVKAATSPITGTTSQILEEWFQALPEWAKKTLSENVAPILSKAQQFYESQPADQKERLKDIMAAVDILSAFAWAKAIDIWIQKAKLPVKWFAEKVKQGVSSFEKAAEAWVTRPSSIRLSPVSGKVLPALKVEAPISKQVKQAIEILKPKDLTPTEMEDLKKIGKLKTGLGITWEKWEYVPDKKDIEIAKVAAPLIKPWKSTTTNIEAIKKGLNDEAATLEWIIAKNNPIIPKKRVTSYIQKVTDEVMDNPEMVGDNKKIAQNLINKYKAIQSEEGGTALGVLKARRRFDEYVRSVKPKALGSTTGNVYDSAVKAIRTGANDFLHSIIKDVDVRASLLKQSNLFRAIDMLAPQKDISKIGRALKNPFTKAAIWAGLWAAWVWFLTK